jgi:DNA-binding MarR family transcriptional regulator
MRLTHHQRIALFDLARRDDRPLDATSTTLRSLQRRGLIQRLTAFSDRAARGWVLTRAGESAIEHEQHLADRAADRAEAKARSAP